MTDEQIENAVDQIGKSFKRKTTPDTNDVESTPADAMVMPARRLRDGDYLDAKTCRLFNFSQQRMDDVCELAAAYLEEHDPEPITADWLASLEWRVICEGNRASIEFLHDYPVQLWKQSEGRWNVTLGIVEFNVIENRGDVRRLMWSLGLEA